MSSSGDKGNFKTDLPQEILDAALDAVKKRESGVEVEVQPDASASEAAPAAANEGAAEAGAPKEGRDKELEQLQLQLDASLAKGRDLMGKIKDEHEKMLRAVADLENFKKRARKENEETQKFGNERLLKDFLPVLDNIDRALEPSNSADLASLRKGVEMIRKLLEDTLGKHGVKAFSSKGKPFDPNVHEAMSQAETDEMPPNHVHTEVLRGFTLNDRLVRPGLVVVSKAKSAPEPPSGEGGSNG
ncbi:MAG: nucleotide exchange factor GrpE [Archangiaceae bacterium]|nr:nucleotide exchange factor GrpE [Archangiaceae bacterium]